MGKLILTNVRVFAGPADLTGVSNSLEIESEIEAQDTTSFASEGWSESIGGLASTSITAGGQWEAGDPGSVDDATWTSLVGRVAIPWTACPVAATEGSLAYSTLARRTTYTTLGEVGDVHPWEAEAVGTAALVRGQIFHAPGTPETADGTTAAVELGALAEGERLYVAAHVIAVAGTGSPELTLRVESDADDTWATPITRATLPAVTAVAGQWVAVVGPITDTWWRVAWDITGTAPSFQFVAVLGKG